MSQQMLHYERYTHPLSKVGGPTEYTYGQNEPLSCLQSDAERGWFNDSFLQYKTPAEIPMDQENLVLHFHKEGHAVLEEDAELFTGYFEHMYYGTDNGIDMDALKTTVFEGQE